MTETVPDSQPQSIFLHRRIAIIRPGRIDIRPARGAVVAPLIGFAIGVGCALGIWFGLGTLPLWLLAVMLVVAVIAVPFAGIGTVYALVGAHVVIDKQKQSATWQQGFLGMGVGTTELVPFWKIERILVEEAGLDAGDSGQPTEEFAQWKILLVKKSGKRLELGVASGPQSLRQEAFDRAWAVALAAGEMCGAPADVFEPPEAPAEGDEPATGAAMASRMGLQSMGEGTDNPCAEDGPAQGAGGAREVRA